MNENIIKLGKNCIEQEKDALEKLCQLLAVDFANCVNALKNLRGRLIVTGIGKSGHIGKKIAASFASTGCPSFFVHAAEASHGDLGMLTKDDIVLALSNSGTTPELTNILHYVSSHKIPLIAVTKNPDSPLAKIATYCLLLSDHAEADILELAPTSSTIQMLALGDALCVALLSLKGFTKEQFKNFHPGGKLGQQLTRVGDIMHADKSLPLVLKTMNMKEAILAMAAKPYGIIGVVDKSGMLDGIITDGDLRRAMSDDFLTKKQMM